MAQMIVHGERQEAASGATMDVRNPATGEVVDSVPRADAADTRRAIDAAAAEVERLDLRIDSKLDPAETTGDPQLLERMIWNLVDNAVRHNEPGGWIRLRTGSSDRSVYFEIANSGPFIADETVPSLFEPFRRIEARTGVRDGVGLGLSIARSVVTAHRAIGTARSQPEGGLDISVVIPRPHDLA